MSERPARYEKEIQESAVISSKLEEIFRETDLGILEKAIRLSGINVQERIKKAVELAEKNAAEGKDL